MSIEKKPLRLIVAGGRHYDNREVIRTYLETLPKETIILQGECRRLVKGRWVGADLLAKEEAQKLGLTVESYPADWDRYGNAGGPIRNREMLQKGDRLVIFHDNFAESTGSKNIAEQARQMGVPVELITE